MTSLPVNIEAIDADVAVLGSGGAGLMAVLHMARAGPRLRIALVSKGAVGRSGCTLMVQGYNAALDPKDSLELHFADLLRGGLFLNDQELAWILVSNAPRIIEELEGTVGCFFDRRKDGRISQKPFAGQSFDRKVYRGDLTGLEIMGRLRDQLSRIRPLELGDVRALDLLLDESGGVSGVALLNLRTGAAIVLRARVVIVATGGAATLYRIASTAREKTGDGLAMCYRAGAELRDMEMMQFLSVGLVAAGSRLAGTLLEETLRIAGAHLYNGRGERFMARYDPDQMERAARDLVVRASYAEIMAGRGTPGGGVLIDISHFGAEEVERRFPTLVARTRQIGKDLAREPVEIAPVAHFQIGGVIIGPHGETSIPGLFVAGEDAGGVHGAGWTGGNGIAESTVFGARAGDHAVAVAEGRQMGRPSETLAGEIFQHAFAPLRREHGPLPFGLTNALKNVIWEQVGPVRHAEGLMKAAEQIDRIAEQITRISVPDPAVANYAWQEALDLESQVTVARTMISSALIRQESRGVHFRSDHPQRDDENWLRYVVVREGPDGPATETRPVVLSRLHPDGR